MTKAATARDLSHLSGETRLASWAGMIASMLFVAVFVLEDLLRSDFDWLRRAVSEHSIGQHGWIQIITFIATGLLFLRFARAVEREFRDSYGGTRAPRFLTIVGWCILLSGPFVTDPAPVRIFSTEATWHGTLHGILGAIGFTLMPVSCFAFSRHFQRNPRWRPLAG